MNAAAQNPGHAVIIGAGHAGGTLATLLRQHGHAGPITLVGSEHQPPYQRPPLSKAWLQQALAAEELLLRPASAYAQADITLRLGVRATAIAPGTRHVALDDGSTLHYDHLVIATGAAPRRLALPGGERPGVCYLRSMDDAVALGAHLRRQGRLAIIGGGYVGLEVAATARKLGAQVRVIEREGRLLSRSASPQIAAQLHGLHVDRGVDFHFNASVAAILGEGATDITGLRLTDGTTVPCEAVLIGVGAAHRAGPGPGPGLRGRHRRGHRGPHGARRHLCHRRRHAPAGGRPGATAAPGKRAQRARTGPAPGLPAHRTAPARP